MVVTVTCAQNPFHVFLRSRRKSCQLLPPVDLLVTLKTILTYQDSSPYR